MTDDAGAGRAAHAHENGAAETMECLADAWTALAHSLGRALPEHIGAAAVLAGRTDILDPDEPGRVN